MSSNNATPFMAQKKVEKRKFLEGILNLGIFGEMLSIARNDFNDAKWLHEQELIKLEEAMKTLESYKQQEEKIQFDRQNKKNNLSEKIETTEQEITALKETEIVAEEKDLEEIKTKEKQLTQVRKATSVATKKISKQEAELSFSCKQLDKKIKELQSAPKECVTCKRPFDYDEETINAEVKKITEEKAALVIEISKLERLVTEKEEKLDKIDVAISKLREKENEVRDQINLAKESKWKIEHLTEQLSNMHKDLESLENERGGFEEIIKEYETKISELQDTSQKYSKRLEVLNAVKFIMSEEGIRSFIVKKILKVLNGKFNYYLKRLDANTRCEFNEYFEESMWDDRGNPKSYFNFSSGEQKRIDLAILFAFQDIRKLQADVMINIGIYDELLDSSLDRKGAEIVLQLLKERSIKNNECIYIISHRKEAMQATGSNIITVQKKNGITSLVA